MPAFYDLCHFGFKIFFVFDFDIETENEVKSLILSYELEYLYRFPNALTLNKSLIFVYYFNFECLHMSTLYSGDS